MIIKIGVKTTNPELVAYREVPPGENETLALATLNATVQAKTGKHYEPTMIVYLDPKEKPGCRKEVWVRIDREIPGVPCKMTPSVRAGFVVYAGNQHPVEHYYGELLKHLEQRGLKPKVGPVCASIEAIYEPEQFGYGNMSLVDEDKQDTYEIEVMIPVED